jgi:hypothetical protein
LIKLLRKIPISVLTLMLAVVSASSLVYSSATMSGVVAQYLAVTKAVFVVLILLSGAIGALVSRLLIRIVYALGSRIFFSSTKTVPDYNFRRLPVSYNDFARWALCWLIVAGLWKVVMMICTYAAPYAAYLWTWLDKIGELACLGLCYLCIDRNHVPAWQSGNCFVALAIPTGVFFVLAVALGV